MKHIRKSIFTALAVTSLSVANQGFAEDVKGDAVRAADKVQMCIGCHAIPGYRSSYPEMYSVPLIGGQSPAYIISALQSYKKGERKHPTMRSIAGSLTDQDMADVAEYYLTT